MKRKTLLLIYYAFFHSIISYGITAWGGAYKNQLELLQNLQRKIIKIINKNEFTTENQPLNLEQLFACESLVYYYENLRLMYIESKSKTRNKNIILPKSCKAVNQKNSKLTAIKLYNYQKT